MMELMQIFYGPGHVFQQPLRRGCRPAHSCTVGRIEPARVETFRRDYVVSSGIDAAAEFVQDLPVGALLSGHEHNDIVVTRKLHQFPVSGANLRAYGIVDRERCTTHRALQISVHPLILGRAHRGLRKQLYVLVHRKHTLLQEGFELFQTLNHRDVGVNLSHQAKHFRMSCLSENHQASA